LGKIRVGIIGSGSIATAAHVPGYLRNPNAELVALADVYPDNAKRLRDFIEQKSGVKVAIFENAEELIGSRMTDAVSVTTPNNAHVDVAKLALRYGNHVLVEKPMAIDVDSAETFQAAARESDTVAMVGMSHRYRNDVTALKRFVDNGDLGEIYHSEARILRRRGSPTGWFSDRSIAGGGALFDIGVHVLDLAWWMMGTPDAMAVSGNMVGAIGVDGLSFVLPYEAFMPVNKNPDRIFDVEDFATALIRFSSGSTLQLSVSWAINGPDEDHVQVALYGNKGGLSLDPSAVYSTAQNVLTTMEIPVLPGDFYQAEIDHFLECIRTRTSPRSTVEQGLAVVRMLQAIRASSEQRREIDLQSI